MYMALSSSSKTLLIVDHLAPWKLLVYSVLGSTVSIRHLFLLNAGLGGGQELCDDTTANSLTSLTKGETGSLLDGQRLVTVHLN